MTYKETVKRMKKLIDCIMDNAIQIIEIALLIGVGTLPQFIIIPEPLEENLKQTILALLFVISGEKIAGGIALFLSVLYFIRRYNKEVVMNRRNVYHDYPYIWYFCCAKILGIKKCNLVLVPIYMQFKLVVQETFDNFQLDEKEYLILNNEAECKVSKLNSTDNYTEINLILEDTYLISEEQLPFEKCMLPTIKVSRNDGENMSRYFSQKFVEAIINEVRKLPEGVTVNVYATTNPMNTKYIVKSAFKIANRGNVKHLNVFQQEGTGKRHFESKAHKIY